MFCFYYEKYLTEHPEQTEQIIKQIWIDTVDFVNLGSESSGNITDIVGAENRKYICSDMFMIVPIAINGGASTRYENRPGQAQVYGDMEYNVSYNARTGDYTVNTVSSPTISVIADTNEGWKSATSTVTYNVYLIVW